MQVRPLWFEVTLLTGICLVIAAVASLIVGGLNNVAVGAWMVVLSLGLLIARGRRAFSLGNSLGPYWYSLDFEAAEQEHRTPALTDHARATRQRAKAFAAASIPVLVIGVLSPPRRSASARLNPEVQRPRYLGEPDGPISHDRASTRQSTIANRQS